jgi:hypothetical protein
VLSDEPVVSVFPDDRVLQVGKFYATLDWKGIGYKPEWTFDTASCADEYFMTGLSANPELPYRISVWPLKWKDVKTWVNLRLKSMTG